MGSQSISMTKEMTKPTASHTVGLHRLVNDPTSQILSLQEFTELTERVAGAGASVKRGLGPAEAISWQKLCDKG